MAARFASSPSSLPAFAVPARADSWAAPTVTEVFSASRDHFVRITPGKTGRHDRLRRIDQGPYAPPNIRSAARPFVPADAKRPCSTRSRRRPSCRRRRLATVDNWHCRLRQGRRHLWTGKLVKATIASFPPAWSRRCRTASRRSMRGRQLHPRGPAHALTPPMKAGSCSGWKRAASPIARTTRGTALPQRQCGRCLAFGML